MARSARPCVELRSTDDESGSPPETAEASRAIAFGGCDFVALACVVGAVKHARFVAGIACLCLTSSCATILHPERKGNRGGQLDTVPLVVDILLFIPGLIPGVVALAVDFSTGAIYTGAGSAQLPEVRRDAKVAIRPRDLPDSSAIVVELVDDAGEVVDRDGWVAGTSPRPRRLTVDLAGIESAEASPRAVPATIRLRVDDRPPVEVALLVR